MDIADADTTELRQLKRMIDTELQKRDTQANIAARLAELKRDAENAGIELTGVTDVP